jgi:2-polyprenyl-3-methyl-5-hydroxy-6-metoxy-1,4-benzoquinol methylase
MELDLDTEPQAHKEGTFEWVVDFQTIKSFLSPEFTGLSGHIEEQRVLVVGCGTSTLSKDVVDLNYAEVVSIDNDSACIDHMSSLYQGNPRLKWYTYDVVECTGHSAMIDSDSSSEMFDLVLDKGTLDAVLVEGAVYSMLSEVHRFMKPGGVYVLFSINSEDMLRTLMSAPALGFEVTTYSSTGEVLSSMGGQGRYNLQTNPSSSAGGVVAVCRKPLEAKGSVIDTQALAEQEREAMDFYFQDEVPLLTAEFEAALRQRFTAASASASASAASNAVYLPVRTVYDIMFSEAERSAYTFDLFLEDVGRFPGRASPPDGFSCDECVEFVRQMQ